MGGFNSKLFLKTKFTPREADVPVPEMRDFFPEGAAAVWRVRGLTGQELGMAAEAGDRNKSIAAILEGLTASSGKDKAEAVKELLGIGGTTPADVSKRFEHMILGSVDPKVTLDIVVRICEVFPIEFFQITNKIIELTGRGQEPGKPKPSGRTEELGQRSLSVTPEGGSSMK